MKVYIARPIPQNAYQILRDGGLDVEINPENRILTKSELIQKLQGKDILLSLLTDPVDGEVLDGAPSVKLVSNYAVGYNNIDVAAATSRGVLVTNTPGVLTETTADLAFCLLATCARQILPADSFTREGKFDKWEPLGFLGQEMYGATLGIIGAGRIGTAMAKRGAKGFDMNILYSDPKPKSDMESLGGRKVEMDELLAQSDFISLHVPLNESTKHLLGKQEFKKMKKSAILINTARGPVVDEAALAEALETGEIAGVGLDVYENEPTIHPGLLKTQKAVIVPHIGSASLKTREAMARIAAENIVAFVNGTEIPAPVNPEVLP
ncbi:D-glycerate dehydrogenase [Candidatus Gracilibacteria bacterium]|nr:D-glycerate dehydrogenase [Candidatus Gracilibacteria bacterium]